MMKGLGIKFNLKIYYFLIGLCIKESVEFIEKIFGEMLLELDLIVYNGVFYCYVMYGEMDKVLKMQNYMMEKGIDLDKMSYNSLIMGQLKRGKFSEVKSLFEEMKV